ncbi:MAG: hypothetical protein JWP10_1530 [Nocardioidaceae bacterium]|nr:hypothetical protein [Nocardioidaceae bacterium]
MTSCVSEYVLVVGDGVAERRWLRSDAEARAWASIRIGDTDALWDLMRVAREHLVPVANDET